MFVKRVGHAFSELLVSEPRLLDGIDVGFSCFTVAQSILVEKKEIASRCRSQTVYRIGALEFAFFKRGVIFVFCQKVVDLSALEFRKLDILVGEDQKVYFAEIRKAVA